MNKVSVSDIEGVGANLTDEIAALKTLAFRLLDEVEELQAQVDREHKAWELMKADRDLWKSRCNEPYDESVIAENIELQAQVDRLTSRGFEDPHHENANLKAALERVNKYADMLCEEYRHGSYFHRIGLDLKEAIKGEK